MTVATNERIDEMNAGHTREHGRLQSRHYAKLRRLSGFIATRAKQKGIAEGDILICRGRNGAEYHGGHLERGKWSHTGWVGCTRPHIPFVRDDGTMEASGGYWFAVDPERLIHAGTREKTFWCWRERACGNGGVYFTAIVNVWIYEDTERIY